MFIPVNDLTDPELTLYHTLGEAQLRHYYEPHGGLFIAESVKVTERALDAGCRPHSLLINEALRTDESVRLLSRLENEFAVPVYTAPENVMKKITGYHLTGGLLCAMHRPSLPDARTLLCLPDSQNTPAPENASAGPVSDRFIDRKRIVVLENVTNPTNAGAIIRSAAAFGMDAVLFKEGSADPLNRRAIRVSMGCVFQVPWTYIKDYSLLKESGYHCIAMALSDHAKALDDPALKAYPKTAVFMGAEGDGLSEETVAFCDDVVCIPMRNGVDSLNVAAAAAVAFWELSK